MLQIFKALLITGLGTITSLGLGALALKIMAVQTGPAGVAVFSMLRQVQQTATIIGSWGGQTAYTQSLSRSTSGYPIRFWTLARLAIVGCFLTALLLSVVCLFGAQSLLPGIHWAAAHLTITIGAAVAGILFFFFMGVQASGGRHGGIAGTQIAAAGTLLAIVACGYFAPTEWRTLVNALALCMSLLVGAAYAWQSARRRGLLPCRNPATPPLDWAVAREFLQVGASSLISAALATGSGLLIRRMLIQRLGLDSAGIFDAAWTVCMMYVLTLLSALSNVYLPKLAACNTIEEECNLLQAVLKLVLAAFVPMVCVMIAARGLVIELLYSPAFSDAASIIRWMLAADLLKVAGFIFAMPLIARGHSRLFLASELLWYGLFWIGIWVVRDTGHALPEHIGIAYLVSYAGYCLFVAMYVPRLRSYGPHLRASHLLCLCAAIPIALTIVLNWHTTAHIDWMRNTLSVLPALAFSAAALRPWRLISLKNRS
ncbi:MULTISPECIES: oligosaccharide flippase family protein [Ralstonia]|uniref:Lipid III flippase n=1 Tax=Ralstonia holmesii TaxID=3058602 RepID=A0ABC8QAN0_9RALS|nr:MULTISPECIES: oligosaccharide flippase family protein [unclassified Ralstonia]CAJ0787556.1 Lipid III flippase [Ralstonia sp. LMG 32967]CAJ0808385.1 Lipid III flippase [Ralstonia sp. LMG 32967]